MAINQIDAARLQAAYLRRDFGDGVPGSLNGRSVEVRDGAQVRASGRGLGLAKIGSLLGRVLNALTPAGVRAESKYRLGVQDFSVALGRLMGDLRNQNGTVNNPQQLARQLVDLLGKAEPVTSRGTSFPELLQARIDLHVEKLGIDDLIALHRSLQTDAVADAVKSLGTDKEKGEAGLVVGMLDRTVVDRIRSLAAEQARQSMTPSLQQALLEATVENNLRVFEELARNAEGAYAKLISGGLLPQSDEAKAKFTFGIVKECLAGLSEADVGRLLQAVSSQDLKALTAGNSSPTTAGVDQAIAREVNERTARLQNAFEQGVARLVGDGGPNPRTDIKAFARKLAEMAKTLTLLRQHADTYGQPIDSKVDEALGRLLTRLDQVPSSRLPLDKLDRQELDALHKAFDRLGISETDQTAKAVREEMERRIAAAQNKVNTATADLAQALQAKDHDATLRALRRLAEAANDKQALVGALGQQKFGRADADDYLNFTAEAVGEALRKLSADQLKALWDALNRPEMKALEISLADAVFYTVRQDIYDDLSKVVNGALHYLNGVKAMAQHILVQVHNVSVEAQGGKYGPKDLPAELRQGIRNVFSLDIPPEGRIRVLSDNSNMVLNKAIAYGIAQPPSEDELRPAEIGGTQLREVVHQFKADLERTGPGQIYEFASGGNVQSSNNVAKDQMLDWAVNELRTLTGGNEVQMRIASLCASQRSLAPLMAELTKSTSPLRLPNGNLAFPAVDQKYVTTKYQISRDQTSGDVVIKVNYSVNGAPALYDANTGARYPVDPATSRINFSYEIAVAPDGTARLRGPVSFDYNLEDEPPTHYDDADWIGTKISEAVQRYDAPFWGNLHRFAQKSLFGENTAFIIELQAFKQNPSLEKAQQLVDRFIREGAPEELNIDGPQRRAVLDAFAQAQQAGQIAPNLFANTEASILALIKVNLPNRMAAAVRDGRFTV